MSLCCGVAGDDGMVQRRRAKAVALRGEVCEQPAVRQKIWCSVARFETNVSSKRVQMRAVKGTVTCCGCKVGGAGARRQLVLMSACARQRFCGIQARPSIHCTATPN